MDQEEWKIFSRTEIISVTAPSVACWAIFASEEGNDEAPEADEFWSEAVHLWPQTRTALPSNDVETRQFIGEEVSLTRLEIVGRGYRERLVDQG